MTWNTEVFERFNQTIMNITKDDESFPRGSISFNLDETDELDAWMTLIENMNEQKEPESPKKESS